MTGPDKQRIKRNSVRRKVGFLMILAVVLLAATFYLFYRNLTSIVASVKSESGPELKILSIREISSDIEKAGNSVRLYTITKNPVDLRSYYRIISGIDIKMDSLRRECSSDSILLAQSDTIATLIGQNIFIWNKLLSLYQDDNVVENLKLLSDHLNTTPAEPQKQGILKRVFRKSPDLPPVELEIAADIDSIVYQTEAAREQMAAREVQLARNSSIITGKFYDLISRMESTVNEMNRLRTEKAASIAGQTYKWLMLAAVTGGLMALLILIIILNYSRNAYASQKALENSKDEALKLAKTKEMFMANMSHEIRTPVTAISGFTDQLLRETKDENITSSLKIIKASSDHLLRIIDDILDFSKLQNNKLVLENVHFSVRSVVSDVFNMFGNLARKNNTKLDYYVSPATPDALIGDSYRLKQILINLIGNSVKFTKNGSVNLTITSNNRPSGEIELLMEFADTGIGIDSSRINSVFEDFTQAESSTTRNFGGTGLGLSIVRKLIDLQKGSIDLNSRKNKGTTIVCRIPFSRGEEKLVRKEIVRPTIVPDELKDMTFLVVDDEEYNRLLFKKIFDRWNVRCDMAVNGMDALELLKEKKYDILFIDMLMPGIDGLKATRFIRDQMKISSGEMPVILISAAAPEEGWEKYGNAGIDTFIPKPFTEDILLSAVLSFTGGREPVIPADNRPENTGAGYLPSKFDLKNLYHISGGDNAFVRQMLESFLSTTEKGLNEMKEAAMSGNNETLSGLAHKLLPPCRHLGANLLCELLSRIEKGENNNEISGLQETHLKDLLTEYSAIKVSIERHISEMDKKPDNNVII